jgi:hypothetical protein
MGLIGDLLNFLTKVAQKKGGRNKKRLKTSEMIKKNRG